MRITIESTEHFATVTVNGVDVPARIWIGTTESGIPLHAFVTAIAVHKDGDCAPFEHELVEIPTGPLQ